MNDDIQNTAVKVCAILLAIVFLCSIIFSSCRSTKNIAKSIQKALSTDIKDSTVGSSKDSTRSHTDNSKYNTEVDITFDSSKIYHAVMDGADTNQDYLYEWKSPQTIQILSGSKVNTPQMIKSITIKTNAQIDTKDLVHVKDQDTSHHTEIKTTETVNSHYTKTVKRVSFYWYIIGVFLLLLLVYYLYRKYKPSILNFLKPFL